MVNIVVVGGGTAGWLTALYAKRMFPNEKISLIEDKNIGILGAGEGTTPQFVSLLEFLDISIVELILKTKSTIKNGILFNNWSKNKGEYFHAFSDQMEIGPNNFYSFANQYFEQEIDYTYAYANAKNIDIEKIHNCSILSSENKVPFSINSKEDKNVNNMFKEHETWSMHFDARLIAEYLAGVGQERGIEIINGSVKSIASDQDGHITSLLLESGYSQDVDFVFDCSGFYRLIIGKFYNSEWISHKDSLPTKKAIPFFLDIEEDIPPYTKAIAMDYGWMWQIPLQHRYGAGYVFDSDFISEDDAKKEIDSLVGFEVESPRTFCFDAGNYKDIWINNCLAIGLSSGFLEPLEATSIWQAILNLEKFFSNPYNLFSRDKKLKELYNKRFVEETQAIVDFLYLHYITDKDNTEFWKNFTRNNKMPEKIKYLMEINNSRIINFKDFDQTILFLYFDYIKVMDGNNILNDSIDKQFYLGKEQEIISRLFSLKNIQDSCVTQKDFIEMIKRNHHEKQ